jgi:hypothetical protein
MNKGIVGVCVAVTFTAIVTAQDHQMAMKSVDDATMQKAYSGCVETGQTGSYTLTHATAADVKTSKAMEHGDSMKSADPMKTTGDMKKDDAMADNGMASMSLALHAAARRVDLSKHVGHKVTVTGTDGDRMDGVTTFNVTTLKMISASCF